jgi:MarR family transcriptional regulator, organic hydroperoxide resistance regulator
MSDSPGTTPHHMTLTDSSSSSAVFGAFMRAMHAHRQLMARRMAAHGISPGQLFCLKEIAHNDGITQRDLAERLNISRPTLTVMLHKMERSSLIERKPDANDQRYTRIHINPKGKHLHEDMHEIIGRVIADIAEPLSETDRIELTRLLGLVNDNITAALENPEKTDS